ncbi:MAG: hypothetical protein IPL06_22530 [Betaproteobacteria bacterium]|nr:hypothetical protein [Betaproteobacteria bacterium]
MTPTGRTRAALVAVALVAVPSAFLAHYAIARAGSPTLGALVATFPLAVIAFFALRRPGAGGPRTWIALAAGALGLYLLWGAVESHFQTLYFLEHAGTNLLLAIMFGRTLSGTAEPLCTRFARIVHGTLTPELAHYSRQVTVAWTVFFLVVTLASCALYLGGFMAAWSVLANFLTLPLVALMFIVEYAVRRRVVKQGSPGHILDGIAVFWRHSDTTRFQAPN